MVAGRSPDDGADVSSLYSATITFAGGATVTFDGETWTVPLEDVYDELRAQLEQRPDDALDIIWDALHHVSLAEPVDADLANWIGPVER